MKLFSALVLFVCVSSPVISGCHTGWLEFQEKCYLFAKITDTWSGASSFCQAFHSTMAEPRTSEQQGFLAAELQQQSNIGSLDYWIRVYIYVNYNVCRLGLLDYWIRVYIYM
ncbi:C-type lectin domain family 2 member D3-like [Mytilus galloprovincialis]|uniref:C-type lectin domain family 2 member D3-like n=1 Tax=Mytilus galloprovincialis TaxID=29158 RepID=UPI003F7CC69B